MASTDECHLCKLRHHCPPIISPKPILQMSDTELMNYITQSDIVAKSIQKLSTIMCIKVSRFELLASEATTLSEQHAQLWRKYKLILKNFTATDRDAALFKFESKKLQTEIEKNTRRVEQIKVECDGLSKHIKILQRLV